MEPGARGRSPVSARVAQKLGGDTVVCIPYRPRKDASCPRKGADADPADPGPDAVAAPPPRHPERDARPLATPDALSLSGTTPPSSPTLSSLPGGPKAMTPESAKAARPQLVLIDSHGKVAAKDADDAHFRKHHRGIGSIDSILSSTTCVNTHSECSRSESRLSREIRIEVEDADGGPPAAPRPRPAPERQTDRTQHAPPDTDADLDSGAERQPDHEDRLSAEEEARLVNEISSWVLRNTFGKDVDDCAAPLLVWDCTYRYLQELWAAAHTGNLGFIQTTSGQGTPSSQGAGTPGSANNDQQQSSQFGKGKRKADGGGSDDGRGLGGRDNGGSGDRGISPASQAYSSKGSGITNFSCPYRKRNPLRFNVRDYYVCATHSFSDMSQLKKHIRAHHPPVQRNAGPFLCPRCCQGFLSKTDLDSHLRRLDVCRVSYDSGGADPEDGITQKIISSLEARSLKAKIDNWVSLWKLLFPGDSEIPDPLFVPVMEIFDFISESKKFLSTLKDLLEIQYRHVLHDAGEVADVELKIRQGLERSARSIYTWIETVVQDWELRISGTVSFFTSSSIRRATSDSWASTPQPFPPSPAPTTPNVASGSANASGAAMPRGASPGATAPAASRDASARRRANPPPKRMKRAAELLPKIQPSVPAQKPPTQIPVPIQRARTPQSQARAVSNTLRPSQTVLPSHSVPTPTSAAPNLDPGPPFHANWENPTVTVPETYGLPYSSNPGGVFQHATLTPTHYATIHTNPLDVQPYLPPDQPAGTATAETMHHDADAPPQSTSSIHASRLMSTTPRSSLASLTWIRDENRDSSQTLVEAHPPGRCSDMYCPSCSKALPDDLAPPPPAGENPVTGPQHHHVFPNAGTGTGVPFSTSAGPGEIHSFADPVEWSFHAAGGIHPAGGNDNTFGGGPGPQEGY